MDKINYTQLLNNKYNHMAFNSKTSKTITVQKNKTKSYHFYRCIFRSNVRQNIIGNYLYIL